MAFEAKLRVAGAQGAEYKVFKMRYNLSRNYDNVSSKPTTDLHTGTISVELESKLGDTSFFQMMKEQETPVSGTITFYGPQGKKRELSFQDAFLVYYEENFDRAGAETMTTTLEIAARIISNAGIRHALVWDGFAMA